MKMKRERRNTANLMRALCLGAVALALVGVGPCGPVAGGALWGDERAGPVDDWGFANEVEHCAVEVRPSKPHSVTVNCMSWQQRLFVSCSDCDGKRWSGIALATAEGRIRIGEHIYPVLLSRVEDPALLDQIWRARANKLGAEPSPRPSGWWSFELRSRSYQG